MQISQFASMAKVSLSDTEKAEITRQSSMLMQSFDTLKSINTDDVDIIVTVLNIKNVLRKDVFAKNISRETLLNNAPEQYGGYFQVPKTID